MVIMPMMLVFALGFSLDHRYRSVNTNEGPKNGIWMDGTSAGIGTRTRTQSITIHTKSAILPANVCCSRNTPYLALREFGWARWA